MAVDDGSDIISSLENVSPNGEKIAGGTARELSPRMELDLAYASEKVLNLEILMMQVAEKASDYEIQTNGSEELLTESIEKAFQFDILSGFLNSEVKEIESFMSSLQLEIIDAYKFTDSDHHLEEPLSKINEKLHHAEESLRSSQYQVADIRKQSDKFEKFLAFRISTEQDLEDSQCSPMNSKWKLQTVEQQRHFLQSLEKSLAREIDLEKKLSESRYNEEEMVIKLHFAEQDACCTEELIEVMMERMFAAENAVELLLGSSKDFLEKLQNGQFSFRTSTNQEWEVNSNMEKGIMKLSAEDTDPEKSRTRSSGPDGFPAFLKKNRGSETLLQLANATFRESNIHHNVLYPESNDMESIIEGLMKHVLEIQSRAESAEERCAQLMKTNVELNDEVGFLKVNGTEKANLLERKLKESDTHLEHAKASAEATEEQQNMLYTALNDMEHLIEDLKGKVSNAENRAESAEAKCTLLTDTNLELNEELNFLRGRLESLEASLHQADMSKIATAKDIDKQTRLVIELVKKLSLEKERLHLQISALTKRNKLMTEKFLRSENDISVNHEKDNYSTDHGNINSYDETLAESASASFQVDGPISSAIFEMKLDPTESAENSMAAVPGIELVRTVEATQLNWKYILMALIVLLVSALAVFLFQMNS